ncbi:Imm8 family immunity protein [Ursidibacter sp. B-7004-1]
MKAELKKIGSLFGDFYPDEYIPTDNCFYISFILSIGPEESTSFDYFDVHICTLDWVKNNMDKPLLLRHTIIVENYDFVEILKTINSYINICTGSNWNEISKKLSRYFFGNMRIIK